MPSRNTADSSHIAPYLTHEMTFHGQTTLIPPDNAGRVRKQKQSRQDTDHGRPASAVRGRSNSRRDPAADSSASSSRQSASQSSGPQSRHVPGSPTSLRMSDYRNSIPDYPPPAYESDAPPRANGQRQEAQPDNETVCPSCSCSIHHGARPTSPVDSDSSADTGSDEDMEIVESTPSEVIRNLTLTERVKRGFRQGSSTMLSSPVSAISTGSNYRFTQSNRTAANSVATLPACSNDTASERHKLGRTTTRDQSIYEEAAAVTPQGQPTSAPTRGSHPFSLLRGGSTSSGSLLNRSSPAFFRSTTSLLSHKNKSPPANPAASSIKSPPPSVRNGIIPFHPRTAVSPGDGFINKKLLFTSSKNKERMKNLEPETDLDTWELLANDPSSSNSTIETNDDSIPSPVNQTRPTPSEPSITDTQDIATSSGAEVQTQTSNTFQPSSSTPHPLSLMDKKVPPPPPQRKTRRPPPPPPLRIPVIPGSPPIVTVRMKKSSLPPPVPPRRRGSIPVSSPLAREGNMSLLCGDRVAQSDSQLICDSSESKGIPQPTDEVSGQTAQEILELAVNVPLPSTPRPAAVPNPFSVLEPALSDDDTILFPRTSSSNIIYAPTPVVSSASSFTIINSLTEAPLTPVSPTPTECRHHYPGRPLPRPPARGEYPGLDAWQLRSLNTSATVCRPYSMDFSPVSSDSTEVTPRNGSSSLRPMSMPLAIQSRQTLANRSEELLIDFNDNAVAIPSQIETSSSMGGQIEDASDSASVFSTESSVSTIVNFDTAQASPITSQTPSVPGRALSELTDLDVLLSRLEDGNPEAGSEYDAMLTIADFIGPASPTVVNQARQRSRPRAENSTTVPVSASSEVPSFEMRTGQIELQRRRVTKNGRVKLKLLLLGITVDKCGICFTQFKADDKGAIGSASCQHAFHARCLANWYGRSKTCPLCRQA